jgi:N-acetyl-anhydromuramyl-L-alanine amidase AmpD
MRKIKYIVIHHNGVAGRTIENIRRSHKARGFSDVGYHYVIHENGVIHRGRPESKVGAHVKGLNAKSIGVCLIGNGNKKAFELRQLTALDCKVRELIAAYPDAIVIAHREVNEYLPKKYHTRKTCPGKHLDLDWHLDLDLLVRGGMG